MLPGFCHKPVVIVQIPEWTRIRRDVDKALRAKLLFVVSGSHRDPYKASRIHEVVSFFFRERAVADQETNIGNAKRAVDFLESLAAEVEVPLCVFGKREF